MDNTPINALDITYFEELLSPLTRDVELELSIPPIILVQAWEESLKNFSIYIKENENREQILVTCLHSYILGFLSKKYDLEIHGPDKINLRHAIIIHNNLGPIKEGQSLDFCLSSCLIEGIESTNGSTPQKVLTPKTLK